MPPLVRRFTATLGDSEQSMGFVELPFDVKAVFGKARPAVRVTLGKHTFRSTVSVYGGRSYVPVRKSNREAAGLEIGDSVKVAIALDTEPRVVTPPPALAAALARSASLRNAWEALSYTNQREQAEAILGAKKTETAARRLANTLAMLRQR